MAQTGKRPTIYSAAPDIHSPAHAPYKHDRAARTETEWQACHAERARLAVRAKIGKYWDGEADNDNDPDKGKAAWPLAKALLAEGNKELLKYAIAYRRIYDTAKSEAVLGGKGVEHDMALEQRYVHKDNESTAKGARQLTAAGIDLPPRRKVAANDETSSSTSSVPKPWNGDKPVNDMIDAKTMLVRLHARLGYLVEPLELAVVDGATLEAVGNSAGIANRAGAMGAGRALVHMGLVTVRDSLGKILTRRDLVA